VSLLGRIGERIDGPDGEGVLLRNQQDRDSGGYLEEAAADRGVLHRQEPRRKRSSRCKRAVKQGDSENGERENSERAF